MLVCGRGVSEDCQQKKYKTETYQEKVILKFQFVNFISIHTKQLVLGLTAFFIPRKE